MEELDTRCVFNQDGSRTLTADDNLQALRSEIAKTILPRQLTFSDDKGRSITCVAASGRVVQVGDQPPDAISVMNRLETFATTAKDLCVQICLLDEIDLDTPIASGSKENSECQLVAHLTSIAASFLTFSDDVECETAGNQNDLTRLRSLASQGIFGPEKGCHFAAFASSDSSDLALIACTTGKHFLLALASSGDLPKLQQTWQKSMSKRNNSDL